MAENGPPANPAALLLSKEYLKLLVLAGIIGVPISAAAFFFLKAVDALQELVFKDVPTDLLGFASTPAWWPLPVLALAGVLTALAIVHLPGTGGHSPADGFNA